MKRVGVTGSRNGFTCDTQKYETLLAIAKAYEPGAEFHHGDCVGVDDVTARYAHRICYRTVAWPPLREDHRAWVPSDAVMACAPYKVRNNSIIACSDVMIAAPSGPEEENPRSGTWATIRRARKQGVPIEVVLADV